MRPVSASMSASHSGEPTGRPALSAPWTALMVAVLIVEGSALVVFVMRHHNDIHTAGDQREVEISKIHWSCTLPVSARLPFPGGGQSYILYRGS